MEYLGNIGTIMNFFHNRIRSRREEIDSLLEEACDFIRERKSKNPLLKTDLFFSRLIIDETLENARIHGNRNDSTKHIELEVEEQDNHIHVTVRDEGPGFDPSSLHNPKQTENIFKRSGRGIHLMKNLANVTWNSTGNEIKIVL